jgi:hypothetical protein
VLATVADVVYPAGAVVLTAQVCPNELKEANDKATAMKEKVKILLMTIKFKFKRFGYRPLSRKIGKDSQKVSVKIIGNCEDTET